MAPGRRRRDWPIGVVGHDQHPRPVRRRIAGDGRCATGRPVEDDFKSPYLLDATMPARAPRRPDRRCQAFCRIAECPLARRAWSQAADIVRRPSRGDQLHENVSATPPGPQTSAICGTSLPKFSPAKSMRSVSGNIAKPATISSRDFVAEREHMRRRTFEGVENVLVIWFHRPRAPNGITRKPGRDHRTTKNKSRTVSAGTASGRTA